MKKLLHSYRWDSLPLVSILSIKLQGLFFSIPVLFLKKQMLQTLAVRMCDRLLLRFINLSSG